MKAIKQIIHYLQIHGELSTVQIAELVALGLLEWEDAPEIHQLPEPAEPHTLRNEVIAPDENEKRLAPQRRSPKRRSRRTRSADLQEGPLCSALQTYFQNAESALQVAVQIAALLSQRMPRQNALITVRNASVSKLAQVLESGLRTQAIRWSNVNNFLQEDGYRKIFRMDELHGPLGIAYRQLMSVPDVSHLGRSSLLLRYVEVQQMFNLRVAQQQLQQAWKLLSEQQPQFTNRIAGPVKNAKLDDASRQSAQTPFVGLI